MYSENLRLCTVLISAESDYAHFNSTARECIELCKPLSDSICINYKNVPRELSQNGRAEFFFFQFDTVIACFNGKFYSRLGNGELPPLCVVCARCRAIDLKNSWFT